MELLYRFEIISTKKHIETWKRNMFSQRSFHLRSALVSVQRSSSNARNRSYSPPACGEISLLCVACHSHTKSSAKLAMIPRSEALYKEAHESDAIQLRAVKASSYTMGILINAKNNKILQQLQQQQ